LKRFDDFVSYARKPFPWQNKENILSLISWLEETKDLCSLIRLVGKLELRRKSVLSIGLSSPVL
jgi:hypothetical protein